MNQRLHSGTACLAMLALASTVAYAAEHETPKETEIKGPTQLSVPLLDERKYPADRPTWVGSEGPNLSKKPHTWVIVTEPCDTPEACDELLEAMQKAAVSNYIQMRAKSDQYDFYSFNNEWIQERLVTRSYTGPVTMGSDEMFEKAVELTFDEDVQAEIVTAWDKRSVSEKLVAIGGLTFVGTVLLICASMFLCMLSRRAERKDAEMLHSAQVIA